MFAGCQHAIRLALNQRPEVIILRIWRARSRLRLANNCVSRKHRQQDIDVVLAQGVERPYLLAQQHLPVLGEERGRQKKRKCGFTRPVENPGGGVAANPIVAFLQIKSSNGSE